MHIQESDLKGFTLQAVDGELGRIRDLLFDDQHWTVRYLDVNTSKWLLGRRVLISPFSIKGVQQETDRILLSLNKQEVKDSPELADNEPISRQYEHIFHSYFNYPGYWAGYNVWGAAEYPIAVNTTDNAVAMEEYEAQKDAIAKSHLRSMNEVAGYEIHASDGDIGNVSDFLIDTNSWQIRYILVDTRRWLPGPSTLLSPAWIKDVSWMDKQVSVDVSKEAIKAAPKFEMPLTHDDELAIFRHYRREPYWPKTKAKAVSA
jgi:uncharacterized protein YrrD